MSEQSRVTVICGHYGCGKTNLTLNLALEAAAKGEKVTVADLDIVNPYFRSSEYGGLLEEHGVRLIAPVFAGTTLDTPTLPPEPYSLFEPSAGQVFIDGQELTAKNKVRLLPPLTITDEEIGQGLALLRQALEA